MFAPEVHCQSVSGTIVLELGEYDEEKVHVFAYRVELFTCPRCELSPKALHSIRCPRV